MASINFRMQRHNSNMAVMSIDDMEEKAFSHHNHRTSNYLDNPPRASAARSIGGTPRISYSPHMVKTVDAFMMYTFNIPLKTPTRIAERCRR